MVVVFVAIVGLGLAVLIRGFWEFREAWVSRSWAKTKGVICRTTIDYQGGGGTTSPGKRGSCFANVIYQYVVNDKEYTSDRQCFGDYRGSETRARSIADSYCEGTEVEVTYNPLNPKQAVLEPGLRLSQCMPMGIGVMLLGGGWLGLAKFGYEWL